MNDAIARISEQLAQGTRALAERLPVILADPRAYPREAMLIAAIAALAVVLALLVGIVIVDLIKVRRRRRRLGVKRRSRLALVMGIVATIIALVSIVSMLPETRIASSQCGSCHEIAASVESWEAGVHASVGCYGCHATGGLSGSVAASVRGVVRLVSGSERQVEGIPEMVFQSRCLNCHEGIRGSVTEGQVRMRHSDVIDAGFACTTCHLGVGHGGEVDSQRMDDRPVMSYCLSCHDGVQAPAECTFCHETRPSDPPDVVPAGNTAARSTCVGCHNTETEEKCIDCHGLLLPHPASFRGEHAGISYRDPALCTRCHEYARASEGCGCHADVNTHGTYSEWFPRHGPQANLTWPGGCNCHDNGFCGFCHKTSPVAGTR